MQQIDHATNLSCDKSTMQHEKVPNKSIMQQINHATICCAVSELQHHP